MSSAVAAQGHHSLGWVLLLSVYVIVGGKNPVWGPVLGRSSCPVCQR